MDRANLDRYFRENTGLIYKIAYSGYPRLMALGTTMSLDDLASELTIVFIKAYDRFDDNAGYKFSTYFSTAAYNCLNHMVEKLAAERIEAGIRNASEFGSDDDGFDILESVASSGSNPAEILESNRRLEAMMGRLSPLATQIMRMVIEPPEFLEHELRAAAAHAERDRNAGGSSRGPKQMNVQFVCSVLDKAKLVSSTSLREARLEIARAAEEELL